jgi:hypothetical protein
MTRADPASIPAARSSRHVVSRALSIALLASFVAALWAACTFALTILGLAKRYDLPWQEAGLFAAGIAAVIAIASRSYQLWRWSGIGPRIGAAFLAIGHIGAAITVHLIQAMQAAGTGSGVVLIPSVLLAGGAYLQGLVITIVTLLVARPAADAAAVKAQ